VTQEATVRVLAAFGTFRGESRFTTWATTVAVRLALTNLRHACWKDISIEAQLASGRSSGASRDPAAGPAQVAERAELRDAVARVLSDDLTGRQREALVAAIDGMPLAELATRLGTNLNAVYKLTHDARRRLKAGLEARGFGESEVRSALEGESR
jgi:RNA polymerase sigma-70 factor (ECF subfamily)